MNENPINNMPDDERESYLRSIMDDLKSAAREMQTVMQFTIPLKYRTTDVNELWEEVQDGATQLKPADDIHKFSHKTLLTLQKVYLWKGQHIPEKDPNEKPKKNPIKIPGKIERILPRHGDIAREAAEKAATLTEMRKVIKDHKIFHPIYEHSRKSRDLIGLKKAAYKILDQWEAELLAKRQERLKKARVNQQAYVAPWFVEAICELTEPRTKAQITNMTWNVSDGSVPKGNLTRYVSNFLTVTEEFGLIKRVKGDKFIKQFDDLKSLIKTEE